MICSFLFRAFASFIDVDIRDDDRLDTAVGGDGSDQRLGVRKQRFESFGMDEFFLFVGIISKDTDNDHVDLEAIRILLIMHLDIEGALCHAFVHRILHLIRILVAERDLGAVFGRIHKIDLIYFITL